jgi:UDP-2,3-diacylglucosamine hydrolase
LHFHGEKEWLVIHSREVLKKEHFDYLIYGHRHLPVDMALAPSLVGKAGDGVPRYINLGEWVNHFSYAVFDGKELLLKYYDNPTFQNK